MSELVKPPTDKMPLHYGWIIVFAGVATVFACLGLGRFSLGMLLPSMGTSLKLTYSQMGVISTGNFIGYMISVILAGIIARRAGTRVTITAGLMLTGISMGLISRASGFIEVLMLYVRTGIGSGLANVPVMGLVSHWFLKSTRGRAAGIMTSGNGLAFVFAGIYVPFVNARLGAEGWRTGWVSMGIICLAVALLAALLLRNSPSEKGLSPVGKSEGESTFSRDSTPSAPSRSNLRAMIHLGLIYFLYGGSYAVYATFIVTTMVKERGFNEGIAGSFWAAVGGLSVISGPLFGWISDRLGRKTGMLMVFTLFTTCYVLAAVKLPIPFLYVSIALFGLAVWSIPTIMSAAVGIIWGRRRRYGFSVLSPCSSGEVKWWGPLWPVFWRMPRAPSAPRSGCARSLPPERPS